jgi:hypothetical protein
MVMMEHVKFGRLTCTVRVLSILVKIVNILGHCYKESVLLILSILRNKLGLSRI